MRITVHVTDDEGENHRKGLDVEIQESLSVIKAAVVQWLEKIGISSTTHMSLFFHVPSGYLLPDTLTLKEACDAISKKCWITLSEGDMLELNFAQLLLPSIPTIDTTPHVKPIDTLSEGGGDASPNIHGTDQEKLDKEAEMERKNELSVKLDHQERESHLLDPKLFRLNSLDSKLGDGEEPTVSHRKDSMSFSAANVAVMGDTPANLHQNHNQLVSTFLATTGSQTQDIQFLQQMFQSFEAKLTYQAKLEHELTKRDKEVTKMRGMLKDYRVQIDALSQKLNSRKKGNENGAEGDTGRRQSRVLIVKSKIANELQRKSRKMVSYTNDSPFWWKQIIECEKRIKRLGRRLSTVCDLALDFCEVCNQFSDRCASIYHVVKKSWEDVENEYAMDILSLNAQMNELGEQFAHMSSASRQLALTIKAVLVTPFRDFTNHHLAQVNTSSKSLKALSTQYELALKQLLHTPQNLPEQHTPKRNFFVKMSAKLTEHPGYDELKTKLASARKLYELKRFDHCKVLNSVINRYRYELILNLCACFSGFETFFHVGYEASLAHKVFHQSIQIGVAQKQSNEDVDDIRLQEIRTKLDTKLAINEEPNDPQVYETLEDWVQQQEIDMNLLDKPKEQPATTNATSGAQVSAVQENVFNETNTGQSNVENNNNTNGNTNTNDTNNTNANNTINNTSNTSNTNNTNTNNKDANNNNTINHTDNTNNNDNNNTNSDTNIANNQTNQTNTTQVNVTPGNATTTEKQNVESPTKEKSSNEEVKQDTNTSYKTLAAPSLSMPDKDDNKRKESAKDPYDVDIFSGYLWKQSTSVRKNWKRRWFVLESGELAYYRSKENMVREPVVDTMLCKVKEREDHELRHVFELISPSRRVYTLQAENDKDFIAWTSVLKNQVHRMLRRKTLDTPKARSSSEAETHEKKRTLKDEIQNVNLTCADCGKKDPEWVSINMGVLICIACSGVHRSLGTHISKVRSIILDDIPVSTLSLLHKLGNTRVNELLEHTIPSDYPKCHGNSDSDEREKFIKGKYMFKLFINPSNRKSHDELNNQLYQGAQTDNLLSMLEAICYGANVDCISTDVQQNGRTPLHVATIENKPLAVELLLQNGASHLTKDRDGKTARELALEMHVDKVADILELHDPSSGFKKSSAPQTPDSDKGTESDHDD